METTMTPDVTTTTRNGQHRAASLARPDEAHAAPAPAAPPPFRALAPVDVFESADALLVLVDLPGVAESGVTLELEPGELRLAAEQAPGAGAGRRAVRFERVLALPDTVDTARAAARLAHGVLRVELPKREEAKPRVIPIAAAR